MGTHLVQKLGSVVDLAADEEVEVLAGLVGLEVLEGEHLDVGHCCDVWIQSWLANGKETCVVVVRGAIKCARCSWAAPRAPGWYDGAGRFLFRHPPFAGGERLTHRPTPPRTRSGLPVCICMHE